MQVLYRAYDKDDVLLYVGISGSFLGRLKSHCRYSNWFRQSVRFDVEHHPTRSSVEVAERKAIINEKPKYNKAHNDKNSIAQMDLLLTDSNEAELREALEEANRREQMLKKQLLGQAEFISEYFDWENFHLATAGTVNQQKKNGTYDPEIHFQKQIALVRRAIKPGQRVTMKFIRSLGIGSKHAQRIRFELEKTGEASRSGEILIAA